jgi:hypothetical protein
VGEGGQPDGVLSAARANQRRESFKAEVAQLLRDKRYESALELLCAARERHPGDAEIARSIRLLRERLEQRKDLEPTPSRPPGMRFESSRRASGAIVREPTTASLTGSAEQAPVRFAAGPLDASEEPEDYAALFKRATGAYMLRDFELAARLFSECCARRPDDTRAAHNLNALLRRMRRR